MRQDRKVISIGFALAAVALVLLAFSPRPKQDLCPVIRIIDGDTIVVSYQGKKEIIRLLRINTPERGRYGYKQATEAMTALVGGHSVRLEFEPAGKSGGIGMTGSWLIFGWTM